MQVRILPGTLPKCVEERDLRTGHHPAAWSSRPHTAVLQQSDLREVTGIAAKRLKKIVLPVPSLADQRRVTAYLDDLHTKIDRLRALQAQTAAELHALLPSILDQAVKGEL